MEGMPPMSSYEVEKSVKFTQYLKILFFKNIKKSV